MDKDLKNRELSWLSFNERVLQEAMDKVSPLVERMRFLGIYSNNMDEFFRVRVATIKRMITWKNRKVEGFPGGPKALLAEIQRRVIHQQRLFEIAYHKIAKDLEKEGVKQVDENTVTKEEKEILARYYREFLRHSIFPVVFDNKIKFPELRDKEIYLAIKMMNEHKETIRYALIEIPSELSRFKVLEGKNGRKDIILLDDIIRLHLNDIFTIFNYCCIEAYTFKISRDAELDIDDDITLTVVEKMEKGIRLRKKGLPVRFVYDAHMPDDLLKFLVSSIGLKMGENIIAGGKYHNFKDFMKFPGFDRPEFFFPEQLPQTHPELLNEKSIIKKVLEKDILFHFPYQKFSYVVDLLREAAIDPSVTHIRISLYRIAKSSNVANALINAIKNGKKVTVVFELFARFDEKNNVFWSNVLTEQGAKVIFGVQGLKVHSKIILITRTIDNKDSYIGYVGTGNFNGETAKIYEDFGLMTSNEKLTHEIRKVFRFMENNLDRGTFHYLLVSPFNTRRKITHLIDNEIEFAKKGLRASIRLKLNNLIDTKLIAKLYEASQAGVKIRIILRGVCALVPQIKGQSENIEIISIVGRYLEHSRVMIFGNNNDSLIYISSADWMLRNLDKRIEVSVPIWDETYKKQIIDIFELQWKDNLKARIIDSEQKNIYRKIVKDSEKINSQHSLYQWYKNMV